MRKLIKIFKSINLRKVVTVFLAGSLILISTACNQGNVAQAEGQEYTKATKQAKSNDYDEYDANQSFKGGMNGYNDDRRYDSETAAKAKTLVDTAKRRKADDLGDFADNVTERAINGKTTEKALGEFSDKLEDNKDKALEYIDNKSDKLQDNLSKVPGKSKQVFDEAVDTAQDAAEDAARASSKTTKNIKDNFEDLT